MSFNEIQPLQSGQPSPHHAASEALFNGANAWGQGSSSGEVASSGRNSGSNDLAAGAASLAGNDLASGAASLAGNDLASGAASLAGNDLAFGAASLADGAARNHQYENLGGAAVTAASWARGQESAQGLASAAGEAAVAGACSVAGRVADSDGIMSAAAAGIAGQSANDTLQGYYGSGGLGDKSLSSLLPGVDLTGFSQEAPDNGTGFLHQVWHGIKGFFGDNDTLEDQVRNTVVDHLNAADRKEYDSETKEMQAYQRRVEGWETQDMVGGGGYPQPPDCPMHDQVNQEVKQVESQITQNVKNAMSPTDRQRLNQQESEYEQGVAKALENPNPMGGIGPLPEPGNAIKDYLDRIKEETERYVANPDSPSYPSTLTQPQYPTEPGCPVQPLYPSEPLQPFNPSNPDYPGQPLYPSQPLQPFNPSNPEYPVEPIYPSEPQYPSYPFEPTPPLTPSHRHNGRYHGYNPGSSGCPVNPYFEIVDDKNSQLL